MKYLSYNLTIATLLLVSSSCQQEAIEVATDSSPVEFRISLPGTLQTRTDEDASEMLLKWSVFEIKEGSQKELVESDEQLISLSDGESTVPLTLQLMQGHDYRVAFAVVNAANSFASFKDGVISVNYSGVASNSDSDDIFVGMSGLLSVTSESTETDISLHRPLAQLNWSTSDLAQQQVSDNLSEITASVTVNGDIYQSLDIIDNTFAGKIEGSLTFSGVALSGASVPLSDETAYSNITTNYLLLKENEDQSTIDCTLHFGGNADVTVNVNNAPAKPNFRTNIRGALLTNEKSVSVTMEEGFTNNNYTGISDNDVIENILAGEDIVVPAGKTLDLRRYQNIPLQAGQKLTVNGTLQLGANAFVIEEEGEPAVIDGTGSITLRAESTNVFVLNNGATLNMNVASFPLADNTQNVFVVNASGTLNINNTIFSKVTADTSERYIINVNGGTLNAENAKFNVETGVFTSAGNATVNLKECSVSISKYTKYYAYISNNCTACFENCNVTTCNGLNVYTTKMCTFKGENGFYKTTYVSSYISPLYISNSNVKISIEGGRFYSPYSPITYFSSSSYQNTLQMTITGGYFNKKLWQYDDYSHDWVPNGYELITNSTAYSGYPYEVRKITESE